MTNAKTRKWKKLSYEILGLLGVVFVVSLFLFRALSLCAVIFVEDWLATRDIVLTHEQLAELDSGVFHLSLLISVGFFIILFLFLLGERLAYIREILKGIDALRAGQMDYEVPLEDATELTQLAEAVNYLSATQREVKEREKALSEEKEQLIRTLSHDIRTPLTSIMAYSEFLLCQESCAPGQQEDYLRLIRKKAEQIKELTDILLDGGRRNLERFEDARLLMEQLAGEFEESLEEEYTLLIDLTRCPSFSAFFDVGELRRIFDNLISNVRKYADPERAVSLCLRLEERRLVIRQENYKRAGGERPESHQMGLNSIRRIAHNYGGRVELRQDEDLFVITIVLSEI